ncbi:MAG: hypothetical protein FJ267_10045, partial [Planctomycetes bacterium]|nr:hypothetical protein [Planctomycetota bacterium]
ALQDPSSNVLTIHPTSGLVRLKRPGSAVIVASQAQGTLYEAPTSITSTITVTPAGNTLQGAILTNAFDFGNVNLEGASLAGATITNTVFSDAKLANTDMTNVVVVGANFASADLFGATLVGATITNAVFTSASLKNVDLSGAVLTNTVFSNSDLSGANLTGVDASGASFVNATLVNVDLTRINIANANFTNTNIKGAVIADVSFSSLQKLQLLKNSENRDISQVLISSVSGVDVLAAVSQASELRSITELDISNATVAVIVPQTSVSSSQALTNIVLNIADSDKFYLPINEGEYFQINGVKYINNAGVIRQYETNQIVNVIQYSGRSVWLIAGSIVGLLLEENTLNTSSFQVVSSKLMTDTQPFMPTTLPTSNSNAPIVYTSSNPTIATINATTGEITVTGNSTGAVTFTATQVHTSIYEPGSITSNVFIVDSFVNFTLVGLNQAFNLSTLALLDAGGIPAEVTDATSVIYVKLSDMTEIFKYQTDSIDVNDVSANDIKYYVFHRKWPAELKLNPVHAMMNKAESDGMLGVAELFEPSKMLAKHDFLRYISLRLFSTIHGV